MDFAANIPNVASAEVSTLTLEEFSKIRAAAEEFVIPYMTNYKDSSHDWSHIQRVRRVALAIAESEDTTSTIDKQLVELASLLHDVGDKKFLGEDETTEGCLRSCMDQIRVPKEMQNDLIWIIERISFRAEIESLSTTAASGSDVTDNETRLRSVLHCVQDADRLDAIGAIGIARCLSFTGARNGAIYEDGVEPIIIDGVYPKGSNARNHFYEKLFRISSMLKTATGRQLGAERQAIMKQFIRQLDSECGLDSKPLELFP